ncbi:MAG: TIGR03118 family protein, partial [Rhodopila sp.]
MCQDDNKVLGVVLRMYEHFTKGEAKMQKSALFRTTLLAAGVVAALGSGIRPAEAAYIQTNLVSNIPGLATLTVPLLVNPWGISRSPTSPFWTSNQGTNTSTLFAVTDSTNVSQVQVAPNGFVAIPTTPIGSPTPSGPQGPTGQVNNTNTASFQLTPGDSSTSSRFIFANLNGTISGWAGGAASTPKVTTPGAVYTGLAINTAGTRLYAANSAGLGSINAFDSSFAPVSIPGGFTDPNLPVGYVPFNVEDINGKIYVTYAPSGLSAQRGATPGQGFVSVFDENGAFLQRLITGSELAAPWGLALAPSGFGEFGVRLMVPNNPELMRAAEIIQAM